MWLPRCRPPQFGGGDTGERRRGGRRGRGGGRHLQRLLQRPRDQGRERRRLVSSPERALRADSDKILVRPSKNISSNTKTFEVKSVFFLKKVLNTPQEYCDRADRRK